MRRALVLAVPALLVSIGCSSNSSQPASTPNPNPPSANAGGPYSGRAGSSISFSASASSDPQHQTLTYAWDFGDNSTGSGVTTTHTYAQAGNYKIKLTVTDTSNLSATATAQVSLPSGNVQAGNAAAKGAHVYLLAAGTNGYGQPSVSLLNSASTTYSDSVGGYVETDDKGNFMWQGDYTCTPGNQVYVYASGGDMGSGNNSALGLLAVLGNCPTSGNFNSLPFVQVNEATTVAAAYALAGFAVDATHVSSSGTPQAQIGIANAFANASNLVTLSTGAALETTPAGNGAVPQTAINTLANILAACTDSSGPSSAACTALFANALAKGASGTTPAETASAAINVAHNPGTNVAALYAIPGSSTPFTPALSAQPVDFLLGISITGSSISSPEAIAVDGNGNVWITNRPKGSVTMNITKLSSLGSLLSGASGYPVSGILGDGHGIAIDPSGNAWYTTGSPNAVNEVSSSGALLSGANGYSGGGLDIPLAVAIDGSGNAWVTDHSGVVEFSNTGSVLSGASGYGIGFSINADWSIAIDNTADVWIPYVDTHGSSALMELSSSGSILSPGYTGGGLATPFAIAFDAAGDAWIVNSNQNGSSAGGITISEFSSSGTSIPVSSGPPGGYILPNNLQTPSDLAIDGAGHVWIADHGSLSDNYAETGLTELANDGTVLSPNPGNYPANGVTSANSLAIDSSGDIWVANYQAGNLAEVIGAAVPVVTPTSVAVGQKALGSRP